MSHNGAAITNSCHSVMSNRRDGPCNVVHIYHTAPALPCLLHIHHYNEQPPEGHSLPHHRAHHKQQHAISRVNAQYKEHVEEADTRTHHQVREQGQKGEEAVGEQQKTTRLRGLGVVVGVGICCRAKQTEHVI